MPWYIRGPVRLIQALPFVMTPAKCAEQLSDSLLTEQPGWFIVNQGAYKDPLPEQEQRRDVVWKHTKEVIGKILSE